MSRSSRVTVLTILIFLATLASADADQPPGTGWTMTRLDLEVRVDREPPGLSVRGRLQLRLDASASRGPTLWLNSREPAMTWKILQGHGVSEVVYGSLGSVSDSARSAAIVLGAPASDGDTITIDFELDKVADSSQLVTRPDIALASWVEAWYPVTLRDEGTEDLFSARLVSIPGMTTLDLPQGWIGLTDGRLVERAHNGDRTIETWDLTQAPVARSLAAGPYRPAHRHIDDRMITIYMLGEHVLDADRLASLVASSLTAQEARFGPFPFAGYGVVEVPEGLVDWGAASQQTFIMATSASFDTDHGNLPLWAHEMCHAWWGNTVGTRGPGHKMAGEALAQLGVLISLESIEGGSAMLEFLEHGRSGYDRRQCARGYFGLLEQGVDHALSTLSESELSGSETHHLVNSKGMWVYHMLRRRVGDDVFFGTLRRLARDFAGREMSLDDIRTAFTRAAPEAELETFFAQWLDRRGAPRIDIAWSNLEDGRVQVRLRQTQPTNPFVLDVELELSLANGSTKRFTVRLDDRETTVVLPTSAEVTDVVLDPDRDLLTWRPSYVLAPMVDGEVLSPSSDWVDPDVYIGRYRIEMLGIDVRVFADEGGLWVDLGDDVQQLFPHTPHRFLTLSAMVDFDVEGSLATGFTVKLNDGPTAQGERLR